MLEGCIGAVVEDLECLDKGLGLFVRVGICEPEDGEEPKGDDRCKDFFRKISPAGVCSLN